MPAVHSESCQVKELGKTNAELRRTVDDAISESSQRAADLAKAVDELAQTKAVLQGKVQVCSTPLHSAPLRSTPFYTQTLEKKNNLVEHLISSRANVSIARDDAVKGKEIYRVSMCANNAHAHMHTHTHASTHASTHTC